MAVVELFKARGIEVEDFGTHSEESTDYPDYAHPVANSVESKEADSVSICCEDLNETNGENGKAASNIMTTASTT